MIVTVGLAKTLVPEVIFKPVFGIHSKLLSNPVALIAIDFPWHIDGEQHYAAFSKLVVE
ncbi:MAG: hypothetical protein ACLQQ4_17280 [Bacteroidia bacterium]